MAKRVRDTRPRLPVPPALRSDVPGTWAHDTMSRRIRADILDRVFRENNDSGYGGSSSSGGGGGGGAILLAPAVVDALRALDAELRAAADTPITPVPDDGGPDVDVWNTRILAHVLQNGETWLSAPWAVAEFYFYRRLMACIGYFREPMDPFAQQKLLGLSSAVPSMLTLGERVNAALLVPPHTTTTTITSSSSLLVDFECFVLTSLWGNRMDLSLWPVGSENERSSEHASCSSFSAVIEAGQKFIIADDSAALCAHAAAVGGRDGGARFDIIIDNAGFELFCDLCLADYLATSGMAAQVHIHLKAHPTFVSDAMAKDVGDTVEFLCRPGGPAHLLELGGRWADHIDSERWLLREDFFWVQPSPMWEMPDELADDLGTSSLVFVKGDANYRRLLGDCAWPYDTPFSDILSYFPAPVCALRTLKAEVGCGMPRSVTDRIAAEDPQWLVSGRYGVVQFLNSNK